MNVDIGGEYHRCRTQENCLFRLITDFAGNLARILAMTMFTYTARKGWPRSSQVPCHASGPYTSHGKLPYVNRPFVCHKYGPGRGRRALLGSKDGRVYACVRRRACCSPVLRRLVLVHNDDWVVVGARKTLLHITRCLVHVRNTARAWRTPSVRR